MEYTVKVLHREAFETQDKYEWEQDILMDNGFYCVSDLLYQDSFIVFARELDNE